MALAGVATSISAIRSEFASVADISRALEAKLLLSNITVEEARRLRFKPYTAQDCFERFPTLPAHRAGFLIPYFSIEGKPTEFYRYRYLEYGHTNGFAALVKDTLKQLRYGQPKGTVNELYLPPLNTDWGSVAAHVDQPIIITEGELKAATACKYGYACLGLGGVWCFRSASAKAPILPQFKQINWEGRAVYICYDSDAATNSQVMVAENELAHQLLQLGALPYILRLPAIADIKKTGLDDYLVHEGPEALDKLIEQALPWLDAQELYKLNEEVVYVKNPGLILRLDNLQRMTPGAFVEHAFADRVFYKRIIKGKSESMQEVSAPREWLKWGHRAAVPCVTFAPGEERITKEGELNTWPGWAVEPKYGDVRPWRQLVDYLFNNSRSTDRKWFEQWLAYPLQHPGTKLYTTALLWGAEQGTGKSLVGYTMFHVYGANSTEISDRDLYSNHNEWAENKQFVMGDEITSGEKKRDIADRMKSLITQKRLRLNPKYVPSYTVPDCINYYFTSNHPDAFFMEDSDRRFFIHEVRDKPMAPEFYREYVRWLELDGAAHLFYYFLKLDCSDFDPAGRAPGNHSKRDMIGLGKSDLGAWVAELKTNPDETLCVAGLPLNYKLWTTTELLSLYDPTKSTKVTLNGLSRELRRSGFLKAYNGMPVKTASQGGQTLWMIRDSDKMLKMNSAQVGKVFDEERKHLGSTSGRGVKF